jgi:hypothetical protein
LASSRQLNSGTRRRGLAGCRCRMQMETPPKVVWLNRFSARSRRDFRVFVRIHLPVLVQIQETTLRSRDAIRGCA